MRIFILNRGSSSIKCDLFDFPGMPYHGIKPLWQAQLQWKNGFNDLSLVVVNTQGTRFSEQIQSKTAGEALKYLMKFLFQGETAVLSSPEEIDVIGHRIVHGGKYFSESALITAEVKEKIRLLSGFAPLHNLPELDGIEILEQIFKKTPQVAVFDTAFHHTMPKEAQIYPGPYAWYENGIQKYGFHGISFQYCFKRSVEMVKSDQLKTVICHLGSGASLCAIKNGKSIDTTMGFTPLEGLMMDTRCGSIDPGIILHLLKKKRAEEISHELYNESGLLGVSGISSDMRDIIAQSAKERAALAFDIYIHRLNALIGSMMAALQGIDVLVFTAGIGENAPILRVRVCDAFAFLGIKLDKIKNEQSSSQDRELSTGDSKVRVLLIHTQEAFEIACECRSKIL